MSLRKIFSKKRTPKFDLNIVENLSKITDFKINIVTEPVEKKWILRIMSERWAQYLKNCTVSSLVPDNNADINFYVNWDIYVKSTNIDVGWFTHCEPGYKNKKRFEQKANEMDFCICPSVNTFNLLPKEKSHILKHGVGEEYKNQNDKIVFGIVAREYKSGRKQVQIIDELKKFHLQSFYLPMERYLLLICHTFTKKLTTYSLRQTMKEGRFLFWKP